MENIMSQFSQFFASNGSPASTANINDWPIICAPDLEVYRKIGQGNTTRANATTFNYPPVAGASVSCVASATTVLVDIIGSGEVCSIVGPAINLGQANYIDITLDGKKWRYQTSNTFSGGLGRVVMGCFMEGDQYTLGTELSRALDTNVNPNSVCNYFSSGAISNNGGRYAQHVVIPSLMECKNLGLPTLRFNQSLKVEIVSDETIYNPLAHIQYRLDEFIKV